MDLFLPSVVNWSAIGNNNSVQQNLLYSLDDDTVESSGYIVSSSDIGDDDNGINCPYLSSSSTTRSCSNDTSGTLIELLIKYSIGSLLIFIIFMSISGNILVCIAIYTDRRLRKLGNLFLASLAVADLFLASLVMTFAVANDLLGYWPFGETFCELWIASDVMCCTSSIINLCAISLDRFIHIKDPLRYENWMSKKVILSSVACIWIVSALVSFLPISLGWHRPESINDGTTSNYSSINGMNINTLVGRLIQDQVNKSSSLYSTSAYDQVHGEYGQSGSAQMMVISVSSENGGDENGGDSSETDFDTLAQCSMDLTPTYAVVSSLISFYIPCLIMIGLYTRLYLYAKKHAQNIKSMSKPLNHLRAMAAVDHESRSSGGSHDHGHGHGGQPSAVKEQKPSHVNEHKAAITLGIIMGVFLFCWVPFFIVNIIGAFCKSCIPELLFKVLTWLGYFNSAMNPVIYSIFNTEFREAFSKILTSYVRNECCNNSNGQFNNYGDSDGHHRGHHNNLNHDTSNFNLAMKRQGINNDTPRVSPGVVGGIGSTGDRSPGGQIIITTGSANNGGGQSVPTVKTPVSSCTSKSIIGKRSSKKVLKDHHDMSSKVRRPLLPFYKRSQSEKKRIKMDNGTTSSSNEDSGGNKVKIKSSNQGTVRSCSLDTFPLNSSSSTAPKPKVSTPLLTYSHVDIHTIDEHGGTISAI